MFLVEHMVFKTVFLLLSDKTMLRISNGKIYPYTQDMLTQYYEVLPQVYKGQTAGNNEAVICRQEQEE